MQETILYKWVTYRLMWTRKYYLSQSTHNAERRKAKTLHRAIWEDNYWPIPNGYDIHHKDWNTFNNDISNLEMVEHRKHLSEHMKEKFKDETIKEKLLEHLDNIRDKTKERHRSEWGKKWHSEHAKESILKYKYQHKCKQCWKEWTSPRKVANYCSSKCINDSYLIEKQCELCGNSYLRNKYQALKTKNLCCDCIRHAKRK